ncbi:MAG: hypothetical protein JXA98_07800 [Methanosarcinaceae archaeon]|nr:hypothetical protein [Methanosarcinaceae archaeon]
MKYKTVIILINFLIASLILSSGCVSDSGGNVPRVEEKSAKETRNFYLGLVPTPKNIPETTWDETIAAYEETGELAEVTMVWTGTNIGQTEKLKQNKLITGLGVYGLKPVLTLNVATIREVPGSGLKYVIDAPENVNTDLSDPEFKKLWIEEAKNLAEEFKPEYLSLGNEINDYFYLYPEQLDDYLSLYDEAYAEIKKASPNTRVFVVFSYDHLIDNNQWYLFDIFNSRVDLVGITTYPWKQFDDPSDIPDDYYTGLEEYTDKPIAFTEIGWISSASHGSSEKEQADFLNRFLTLTEGMDIEMVNWLFLHEPEFTGVIASVTEPETSAISLKNRDGSKKEIYDAWLEMKKKEYKWIISTFYSMH